MPRPYSSALQLRVLRALERSQWKRSEIAERYQIRPATLCLWQRQRREEALEDALAAAIEEITAADARGRLRHCGYSAPPC